jgi:hypothetical protein
MPGDRSPTGDWRLSVPSSWGEVARLHYFAPRELTTHLVRDGVRVAARLVFLVLTKDGVAP